MILVSSLVFEGSWDGRGWVYMIMMRRFCGMIPLTCVDNSFGTLAVDIISW